MHDDRIDSHRLEKNDFTGDAMALRRIGRIHKTAAVFHDEDLAAKALNVRQCLEECSRFCDDLLHRFSLAAERFWIAHVALVEFDILLREIAGVEDAVMRTSMQKNVEIEFGGPDDFRQDSQCSLGR